MKLDNSFEVSLPLEETWALLQDLPRIAPCLPGTHLDDVVDGEYRGGLTTRIGPINARYAGTARFLERDDVSHRAVIQAQGREERGSGTASATVTATLHTTDSGTRVDLSTDMAISGRAAQFGRSLMAEISSNLISEFARRLETMTHEADGTTTLGTPVTHTRDDNSLDAARTVVVPILRRTVAPVVVGVFSGLAGWWIGRRTARPAERALH